MSFIDTLIWSKKDTRRKLLCTKRENHIRKVNGADYGADKTILMFEQVVIILFQSPHSFFKEL